MKINKILKITLIILVIILLSIISFIGIYIQDKGRMINVIKEYSLGMDLKGSRKVELEVNNSKETINYDSEGNVIPSNDTETEVASSEEKLVNDESVLNAENYKQTKKILEKRLKTMGVTSYEMRLDEKNGKIVLNISEDDKTDVIVSQMAYQGKFEIIDKDTNEVLMTNEDLEYAKAGYGTTSSGTTSIFVNIQFDKEGTEKFRNITNTYLEMKTTDEETGEEKTTKKEITLKLDDTTILTTHFDEEIANGLLQLSVGSSSSNSTEELQDNLLNANNLAAVLNNGKIPVAYEVSTNQYIASEIQSNNIALFISLLIVLVAVGAIYLVIIYKENGILATFSLIGYIAVLLLTLRYTNTIITVYSLVAIVLSIIITYITILKILQNNVKIKNMKEAFKRTIQRMLLILIPVMIIAIIFTFNTWLLVSSFGMVMFWGIVTSVLYNFIFTRTLLMDSKN